MTRPQVPDACSEGRLRSVQSIRTDCHDRDGTRLAEGGCLGAEHSFADTLRQRASGIALGQFDCNNSARLRADRSLTMLLRRDPDSPRELAYPVNLSHFENAVRRDVMRMACILAATVL